MSTYAYGMLFAIVEEDHVLSGTRLKAYNLPNCNITNTWIRKAVLIVGILASSARIPVKKPICIRTYAYMANRGKCMTYHIY